VSVRVQLRRAVADDLGAIVDYLRRENADVALRFAEAAQATLARLAEFPGLGSLKHFRSPRLRGVRSYAVRGFPNHLILYRAMEAAIDVLAVVHGARDLPRIPRERV
jgi:toxin ParE1/3/4